MRILRMLLYPRDSYPRTGSTGHSASELQPKLCRSYVKLRARMRPGIFSTIFYVEHLEQHERIFVEHKLATFFLIRIKIEIFPAKC